VIVQLHTLTALPLVGGWNPRTHWIEGWVVPRVGQDVVPKNTALAGSWTPVIQSIALSLYCLGHPGSQQIRFRI